MNRFGDAPVESAPSPESSKPTPNRFGDMPMGQPAAVDNTAFSLDATDFQKYPSRPDLQAQADQQARSLATGDIATREKGLELVPVKNGDGTTTYVPTQTQPVTTLSNGEKAGIYAAQSADVAGRPIGGQTPEEMQAQIRGATAQQNTFLQNAQGRTSDVMARIGTGLVGALDPALENKRNANLGYTYDPDSAGAFVGSVIGNALPLIPALGAGMLGKAAEAHRLGNATSAILGGSQFGSVRGDVAERRARGEQISVGQELSAAALSAAAEFAGEKVGIGAMTSEGRRFFVNKVAQKVAAYASSIGVNAAEEHLTQIAQNAVNKAFVDENQDLGEGVADAASQGAAVGSIGGVGHLAMHGQRANIQAAEAAANRVQPPTSINAAEAQAATPSPEAMKNLVTAPQTAAPVSAGGVNNTASQEAAKGPTSLDTAKTKFRIQDGAESRGVEVQFDSPEEKALYIANQPRKGKLQQEAIKFLTEAGYDEQAVGHYGDEVQARVEEAAKGHTDGVLRLPAQGANANAQVQGQGGGAVVGAQPSQQVQNDANPSPVGQPGTVQTTGGLNVSQTPQDGNGAQPVSGGAPGAVVSNVAGGDSSGLPTQAATPVSTPPTLKPQEKKGTSFLPSPQAEREAVGMASSQVENFKRVVPKNREMIKASQVFEKRGVRTVFFTGESRGFRMKKHPGLIFVNANSPVEGFKEAISHEFMHELHDSRPSLYQAFSDSLTPEERAQWESDYTTAFEQMRPGQKPAHLNEEGVTMPFGKLAREHSRVWSAALGRNPSLAQKIMDFFREFAAGLGHGKSKQIIAAVKAFEATLAIPVGQTTANPSSRIAALPDTHPGKRYGGSDASFLPNDTVRTEAEEYAKQAGLTLTKSAPAPVNVERAKEIAAWYEKTPHAPNDPAVKASYDALKRETLAQYEFLKNKGVKFEPWGTNAQPYANSDAMQKDVRDNRHLGFFQGGDMPADHPMAAKVSGTDLTYNDIFRAVHDYFGHAKEGNGFGPKGEEAAFVQHSQMYSPAARPAMAAETRGQNSWVNYGPKGEANRANPQATQYAEQKAVVMPEKWANPDSEGTTFLPEFPPKQYPETEYGYWVTPEGKAHAVPTEQHDDTASKQFGFGTNEALTRGYIRVVAPKEGAVSVELSEDTDPKPIRPFIAAAIANGRKVLVDVFGSGESMTLSRQSDLAKLDKVGAETPLVSETSPPKNLKEAHARKAASADFLPGRKWVSEDVKPALASVSEGVKSIWDGIRSLVVPHKRSADAKTTALVLRERGAELAQRYDRLEEAFGKAHELFEKVTVPESRQFIDDMEHGRPQANPSLQPIADAVRQILDDRLKQVQGLGTGKLAAFIKDYFPHLWENPTGAAKVYAEAIAKSPVEGKKGFLKQRTLPTLADGLARGLKPITENPVEAMMLRVREMDKYITAQQAFAELRTKGLMKKVRAKDVGKQDGYARIDDNIATLFAKPSRRGAIQIAGYWMAPEPVANVINNYLSPGIRGSKAFGKVFRGYLGVGNLMNQVQLGLSFFHALNTVLDSATSSFGLGISRMAKGEFVKGGKEIATALTFVGPGIQNFYQGNLLMKEWLKPGSTTPQIAMIADAMKAAGGRKGMDEFYQTNWRESLKKAWKGGNVVGSLFRLPMAAIEATGAPVLEKMVPQMKRGVFFRLAQFELEHLAPGASRDEVRKAMANAWDSVDNRMGELVYDNLFWNKAVKDLAMASTRSVGWNLGTIRELGGGILDTGKLLGNVATGNFRKAQVTHKMAYLVAMPVMAGLLGGIIHKLLTGKDPEEMKDWFFPKTGQKDKDGKDVRLALPSYMKDVLAYGENPVATLANKTHPMLNTVLEMLSNKDYYGTEIRGKDDTLVQQAIDLAEHAGKSFMPFGVREVAKLQKEGQGARSLLPLIGIVQARRDITDTPAERMASEIAAGQRKVGSRTHEEADRAELVRDLADKVKAKTPGAIDEIKAALKANKLTESDIDRIIDRQHGTGFERTVKHLEVEDAMRVWRVASPDERRLLAPMVIERALNVESITADKKSAILKELAADWHKLSAKAEGK